MVLVECGTLSGDHEWAFYCPGCKQYHSFVTERVSSGGPEWSWNGDTEKPTFWPSLLVNGSNEKRCHSWVRDGRIEYLADCWHDMRGKTVGMAESTR